jgi:hypothetical protein
MGLRQNITGFSQLLHQLFDKAGRHAKSLCYLANRDSLDEVNMDNLFSEIK